MKTSMKRKIAAILATTTLMTIGAGAAMAEYGDAEKDNGPESRYKVGQQVEVYNSPIHWTTKTHKIISAEKNSDGQWTYKVDMADVKYNGGYNVSFSSTTTIDADDIEAPKN